MQFDTLIDASRLTLERDLDRPVRFSHVISGDRGLPREMISVAQSLVELSQQEGALPSTTIRNALALIQAAARGTTGYNHWEAVPFKTSNTGGGVIALAPPNAAQDGESDHRKLVIQYDQ